MAAAETSARYYRNVGSFANWLAGVAVVSVVVGLEKGWLYSGSAVGLAILVVAFVTPRRIELSSDTLTLVPLLPLRPRRRIRLSSITDVTATASWLRTRGATIVQIERYEGSPVKLPAAYGLSYQSAPLSAEDLAAALRSAKDAAQAAYAPD